jgi:hypothetical protein
MKNNQLKKIVQFKAIPNRKLMFLYLSKKYYKVNSVPHLKMTIYNLKMTIYSDSLLKVAKMVLFNTSLRRYLTNMFSIKYKYYAVNLNFDSRGIFSNISFFPTFFNKYSDFYSYNYKKRKIRNADFKFALPIFRFSRLTRNFYPSRKTIMELLNSYPHLKIKDLLINISNDLDYII